jgi:hypothetical protein
MTIFGTVTNSWFARSALSAAVAAVLLAPGLAVAHEGHTHTIKGTVTARSDRQVSIRQTDGKTVVVVLNDKTTVLKGDQKIDRASLAVGQRVIADVGDGKTPLVATSLKVGAVETPKK